LTVLLLGMMAVVLLVTFSNKGLLRRIMMERELQERRQHVEELRADIAQLRRNCDLLRDDKATIERVARESHGMIRRGEVVFRVRPLAPRQPQ
jgi:cell division protein FtsB